MRPLPELRRNSAPPSWRPKRFKKGRSEMNWKYSEESSRMNVQLSQSWTRIELVELRTLPFNGLFIGKDIRFGHPSGNHDMPPVEHACFPTRAPCP